MSKTRKILSVVLAAALVFALAIPAFAVSSVNFESVADAATYTQEWSLAEPVLIEDDELFPGHIGEYYIDVILKTNYPTGAVEFEVETTGDVVFEGAELYEYYMNEDGGCDADINFNNNKVVLVPDSSVVDDAIVFTTAGDEGYPIATIFVSGTSGTAAIKNDPKNEANPGGSLIAARLNPAKVTGTMIVGQTATVGDAVTIGTVATPVLRGINGGYVDEERKYVYGAPAGLTELSQYFTVDNGTFTLEGTGTGAVLTVKDLEGADYDTYTLIIFGDVDGNNAVNSSDITALAKHVSNVTLFSESYFVFAADVDASSAVNSSDITALAKHVSNVTLLANNIYA